LPDFELRGKRINYTVLRGTSRHTTYFRFRPDLTLEVIVPRARVDLGWAISQKEDWILRRYEEMKSTKRILDDERVMYQGTYLDIVYEQAGDKEEILPDPARGTVTVRASDRSRVLELVRRWFLKESSRYVMKKLSELSQTLPKGYRMADVREIKNWGYCTHSGRVSFSWQLIALPERLREYVIMHELTHLEEFNHSRAFWARLARRLPDCRLREKELDAISPAELSKF